MRLNRICFIYFYVVLHSILRYLLTHTQVIILKNKTNITFNKICKMLKLLIINVSWIVGNVSVNNIYMTLFISILIIILLLIYSDKWIGKYVLNENSRYLNFWIRCTSRFNTGSRIIKNNLRGCFFLISSLCRGL